MIDMPWVKVEFQAIVNLEIYSSLSYDLSIISFHLIY